MPIFENHSWAHWSWQENILERNDDVALGVGHGLVLWRLRLRRSSLPSSLFLSWHAAKSFIKNLTLESFIPTNMLSINKKTMRLGVTSIASKVPDILVDTGSWRHIPLHLVRFSHAFPLDSFSRAAWTRSHVRCWQLSSLGKNLEFRYLQVMLIDNIRFTIPTP